MPWFVKLEEGLVDKPRFDQVVPAHLEWLAALRRSGHRPTSGYWADRVGRTGDGAGGMLLFEAADWAEADALVRTDPLIAQGCVRWTLHEWRPVFTDPALQPQVSGPDSSGPHSSGPHSSGMEQQHQA